MSRPISNEVIEDIEWMAHHGESLDGAARRLERSTQSLERLLLRRGRSDLVASLKARNPINPLRFDQQRESLARYRKDHAA